MSSVQSSSCLHSVYFLPANTLFCASVAGQQVEGRFLWCIISVCGRPSGWPDCGGPPNFINNIIFIGDFQLGEGRLIGRSCVLRCVCQGAGRRSRTGRVPLWWHKVIMGPCDGSISYRVLNIHFRLTVLMAASLPATLLLIPSGDRIR